MEPTPAEGRRGPDGLRVAGFGLSAFGGLLLGVGSILSWGTYSLGRGSEATDVPGIDLPSGWVAFGAAVVVLIGIPAMRAMTTVRSRHVWAGISIAAALIAAGAIIWVLLNPDDTIGLGGAEKTAAAVSEASGLPVERLLDELRPLSSTELAAGVWVALAGAALALVGGVLGWIWATSAPLPSPAEAAARAAALEQAARDTDRPDEAPPNELV